MPGGPFVIGIFGHVVGGPRPAAVLIRPSTIARRLLDQFGEVVSPAHVCAVLLRILQTGDKAGGWQRVRSPWLLAGDTDYDFLPLVADPNARPALDAAVQLVAQTAKLDSVRI